LTNDFSSRGQDRSAAFAALDEAFEESREEGWDGYGAAGSSVDALIIAKRVLASLPITIPSPEIDVAPSGNILFEWRRAPRQVVAMTIAPRGELSYASLFGGARHSGVDLFSESIPSHILEELYRLYL